MLKSEFCAICFRISIAWCGAFFTNERVVKCSKSKLIALHPPRIMVTGLRWWRQKRRRSKLCSCSAVLHMMTGTLGKMSSHLLGGTCLKKTPFVEFYDLVCTFCKRVFESVFSYADFAVPQANRVHQLRLVCRWAR